MLSKATILIIAVSILLNMPETSHANLINDGSISLSGENYNIIYDTTLDITWLDYSHAQSSWTSQIQWANNLSLTFDSTAYSDWRLPQSIDGSYKIGYDSSTTAGWNITSSELGHLFYEELGNIARVGTDGSIQENSGLLNTGPFTNLLSFHYWSGTEYGDPAQPLNAWRFSFIDGGQYISYQGEAYPYALAVHEGRLEGNGTIPVPEPITIFLLGAGFTGLISFKKFRSTNVDAPTTKLELALFRSIFCHFRGQSVQRS